MRGIGSFREAILVYETKSRSLDPRPPGPKRAGQERGRSLGMTILGLGQEQNRRGASW